MLIICPQCTNRLQVDAVMATGKTFRVRCSRCQMRFEVDRLNGKPTGVVGDAPPNHTPTVASEPARMRTERGTTVVGTARETTTVGAPRVTTTLHASPSPQAEEFRRTLPDRYKVMRELDELTLLGVDSQANDVDLLHAYLKLAEEWRPSRYEGFLNAAEMEMVRTISTRLDRSYNDLGDLARRKRIMAERGEASTPAPKTGPLPLPIPPRTNTVQPKTGPVDRGTQNFPREETSASIFFGHGLDALKGGRLLEAREHFQHCISLDPKRPEFHLRLGQTVIRLGDGNGHTDWTTVERCYTEALNLSPDSVEVLVGMAKHWQLRGQPSIAMKYYKRVRDLEPDHMEAAREIRLYLMRKKKDQHPTPTTSKLMSIFGAKK